MRDKNDVYCIDEGMRIINGIPSAVDCLVGNIYKTEKSAELARRHYHNYIELLYGLEGEVKVHIFDAVSTFKEGELLVINPREPHSVSCVTDKAKYAVVKFMPEILYANDSSVTAVKYILPFMLEGDKKRVFSTEEIGDINQLMSEIIDEWQSKGYAYELILRANIVKVFSKVLRYFQKGQKPDSQISYEVYAAIEKALDYVANEYPQANAKTAAEICNLSYSYFSRNFKKIVKRPFCDYVNYIRLIEAERLMFTTDKTITEIASDTGFATTSHFIKRFKEYKNKSPKQFRLSVKG